MGILRGKRAADLARPLVDGAAADARAAFRGGNAALLRSARDAALAGLELLEDAADGLCAQARALRPARSNVAAVCEAGAKVEVAQRAALTQLVVALISAGGKAGEAFGQAADDAQQAVNKAAATVAEAVESVIDRIRDGTLAVGDAIRSGQITVQEAIAAGLITVADAIRQGLLSCRDAKDAGLLPALSPCP